MQKFQKTIRFSILFVMFCVISISAQPKKEHIAVIELKGKITQSESAALTNKVINEILKTDKYLVFERSQMDEILKEQGFQQTGCTSTECAIEIGQLLGVQNIVFGNIEKVGSIYSISLKMVNIETGEIARSTSLDFKGSVEEILTRGIIIAVQQLMGETFSSEQVVRSPTKVKTTLAIINAVVGVGSGGACIFFWIKKADYNDKYSKAYSQDEIDNYYEKGNTAYTLAGIFTGVSGVTIPTSIILFALRKKIKKKPNVSINTFISPEFSTISISCAF